MKKKLDKFFCGFEITPELRKFDIKDIALCFFVRLYETLELSEKHYNQKAENIKVIMEYELEANDK